MATDLHKTTQNIQDSVRENFLFPELNYLIIGLLIEIHKELGQFGREKQYGDLFEKKLMERNLFYRRELRIGDSGNIIDFVINNKVIVEFKTVPYLVDEHYSQVKRYLLQSGYKLGILINFRDKRLKPKRVLNINNLQSIKE